MTRPRTCGLTGAPAIPYSSECSSVVYVLASTRRRLRHISPWTSFDFRQGETLLFLGFGGAFLGRRIKHLPMTPYFEPLQWLKS